MMNRKSEEKAERNRKGKLQRKTASYRTAIYRYLDEIDITGTLLACKSPRQNRQIFMLLELKT